MTTSSVFNDIGQQRLLGMSFSKAQASEVVGVAWNSRDERKQVVQQLCDIVYLMYTSYTGHLSTLSANMPSYQALWGVCHL